MQRWRMDSNVNIGKMEKLVALAVECGLIGEPKFDIEQGRREEEGK
jgi:hypothetical protein